MRSNVLIPDNFLGKEKGFSLKNFIEISKRTKKTANIGEGGGSKNQINLPTFFMDGSKGGGKNRYEEICQPLNLEPLFKNDPNSECHYDGGDCCNPSAIKKHCR